ncbi:hypothetical protein JL720_1426 [Aureococcus anophagefferens]|nr:hypothetical protein JL720_1426 [Aureococcus anophagefferens]
MAASLEAIQAAEASLARASLDNNSTDASTDPYADEDRIERDLETLPSKAKGPALAALAAAVKASRASFDVDAAAFVALVVDGGLRCVDVRSPGEFAPRAGAVNALFDGVERAGRPRRARGARAGARRRRVCVHCWRGSLRSGAVAWLLRRRGFDAVVLRGGHRAYRAHLRSLWDPRAPQPRLVVVGGRTGVGKTRALGALAAAGRQVLDLEALAKHRGSAFGWRAPQPTNEAYESLCGLAWRSLDTSRDVFVEDEEGHVGTALVPPPLYELMRLAPVVLKIECAYETRVANLLEDYAEDAARDPGAFDGRLRDATRKVSKRLGGDRTAEALALLDARDLAGYARLLLERYYDKLYDKHLAARARTDAPCWTWAAHPSTRAPSPRASSRRSTPTTPRGAAAPRAARVRRR